MSIVRFLFEIYSVGAKQQHCLHDIPGERALIGSLTLAALHFPGDLAFTGNSAFPAIHFPDEPAFIGKSVLTTPFEQLVQPIQPQKESGRNHR
ncbi:hypothetical protein [Trichococcus alkaliphilus]|uniref:hypothetical protein n=1 Tax=Trichococcus alkaliphilus TaxID=2052943 RepID=UPI00128FE85D|nr:hypothetical protein [Trichococcus alkaliphilus]